MKPESKPSSLYLPDTTTTEEYSRIRRDVSSIGAVDGIDSFRSSFWFSISSLSSLLWVVSNIFHLFQLIFSLLQFSQFLALPQVLFFSLSLSVIFQLYLSVSLSFLGFSRVSSLLAAPIQRVFFVFWFAVLPKKTSFWDS